ncbi:phage terminase large subunit family protein, partial [bacterium]|nr:phage terminase large subunit family protein [bacterium]
ESNSGLKYPTKAGRLITSEIHYLCDFCHEAIFEHQKVQMLQKIQPRPIRYPERIPDKAQWITTKTPDADFIASYQIGALYSPFFSWGDYVFEYLKALKKPENMQTFVNQRDGLPWKIIGQKPDIQKVTLLRGKYKSGEIPHEVLFLTAAVDVQHGQENWESDDSKNRPRLELEIKGHGEGYRLFGIIYQVFEGYLEDIYSGAWEKFREFITGGGFTYKARGMTYDVKICLIDAGSAKYTDQIYNFCREMGVIRFSPLLGFNTLQRQKKHSEGKDSSDESSRRDWDRFRRVQENDIILYQLSTYVYKVALYSRLNTSINFIKDKPGERTPAGYQGFPEDYTDHYFDMLLSEEHLPDKNLFKQVKKHNESLDLTIYNMAGGEIWLYQQVVLIRAKFAAMKAPANLLTGITAAFVIKMLKAGKAKGRALSTAEIKQQLKTGKS